MKYKYLIIIVVLVILIIILIPKKPKQITNIKHFHFGYSTGYAMNSNEVFEIDCSNTCIVSIKLDGESDEDTFKKEISKEEVKKVEEILNKYNVSKWNGFNKRDKRILDGNSFSLNIYSDIDVTASGYMKYPKNYKSLRDELYNFFILLRK